MLLLSIHDMARPAEFHARLCILRVEGFTLLLSCCTHLFDMSPFPRQAVHARVPVAGFSYL